MYDQSSLLADIDVSLTCRSSDWRASALNRLTALFMAADTRHSPEHVALYDQILPRFINAVDPRALAGISDMLARSANAPPVTIEMLARNRNVAVAGPILEASVCLSDDVLAGLVGSAEREALLMIACRKGLGTPVSDALIARKDSGVSRALFANASAQISELGYVQMIDDAKTDETLLAAICARTDIPAELKPFFEMAAKPVA